MSNGYFQFKQFRIAQDACAMKVTTDACIQGAWTPVPIDAKRILDIGTGTGLLALMMAQRSLARIDALELGATAAQQAKENVAASPWADRVAVWQGNAVEYTSSEKYDLVICNPPFFSNSLPGPAADKNMARHTASLSRQDLFAILDRHLSENGCASILLPEVEYQQWAALLKENDWQQLQLLHIRHTRDAIVKRIVSICGRKAIKPCVSEELVIKDGAGYTAAFIRLLSPFYLLL